MRIAVIVAGGSGSRMTSEIPKQFMLLAGTPLLMHTINRFFLAGKNIRIILVLPEKEIPQWKSLCREYSFDVPHEVTAGGVTRFDSVKNGLQLTLNLKPETLNSVVAIHDGVRPLTSSELINRCFEEAEKNGSAVPCIPVQDSMRMINENKNQFADRRNMVLIQTPQCFSLNIILNAYKQQYNELFTDDASVVESLGNKINLIPGERNNIKITYPEDLRLAEALLS